jgi:hypothetical protein
MAEVVGQAEAVLTADTSPYEQAMAKVGDALEKLTQVAAEQAETARKAQEAAAQKAAAAAISAAKKAEQAKIDSANRAAAAEQKAAEAAARKMESDQRSAFNKISAASAAMASQVGGNFGHVVGVANSAVRPLTEVGAEFGAIGAAAVAVAATGVAMYELASGAEAADKRLQQLGIHVDSKAQGDIDAYRLAQQHLAVQLDETKVAAGSGFAEAFAIVDQALSTDLGWLTKYVEKLNESKVDVIALHAALDWLAKAVGIDPKAASAQAAYTEMLEYQGTVVLPKNAEEMKNLIAAQDQSVKSDKEATDVLAALAQQRSAGIEQLRAKTAQYNQTLLGPREQIYAALSEQYHQIGEIEAKTGDATAATQAYTAASLSAERQLHDVDIAQQQMFANADRGWDDFFRKFGSDLDDLKVETGDALRTINKTQRSYWLGMATESAQALGSIAGDFASLESTVVDSFQAQIDAGDRLTRAQVQQGNRAIDAAEAAQIAQAGITAAITAASGIASLQLSGVPPFIAIPLGIAEGAGLFTATVAGIRQHTPIHFSWNSGPTWTPPGGTATNDQLATGAALVGEKGGNVTTGEDAPTGAAVRHGGSSTQRSGRDGTKVEVKVTPGRVGKFQKRGGRA